LPKDLASGGSLPPPPVGLGFASAERASPRSKSRKIEAPPPCLRQAGRGREASRSEKRHQPVIAYLHSRPRKSSLAMVSRCISDVPPATVAPTASLRFLSTSYSLMNP